MTLADDPVRAFRTALGRDLDARQETRRGQWIRGTECAIINGTANEAAPAPLARCSPGPNPYQEGLSMDTIRLGSDNVKQAR